MYRSPTDRERLGHYSVMEIMMRFKNWLAACAIAQTALLFHSAPANAQATAPYPSKPITIVVPWAPGGAADFLARAIAPKLGQRLGTTVIVDNRPGAATNIGTQLVASSAADGYTLLMASSNNTVNVTLLPSPKLDFVRDFRPIVNVGLAPNVLVAPASLPANDVKSLVALARKSPGELTYGSSGNGSASHLAAELFKQQAKVDIVGVPYKGSAPAMVDLIGDRLSVMFTVIPTVIPHVKANKLKMLAVASPKRLAMFPDVPTLAESGLPGFESSIWYGLVAPAKTPDPIVERLQAEVSAILRDGEVIERMQTQGTFPIGDTPAEFAATIKNDVDRYARLIKAANIKAD